MRLLSCVVFLFSSIASAETHAAFAELPMQQLAGKQVIVPVSIGDQTDLRFMLDTGANGSVISPATAAKVGASARGETAVAASGAGGRLPSTPLVQVSRVRIGDHEYAESVFGVVDLSNAGERLDGILGQDFLSQNDVELDFVRKRLRIYEGGALRGDKRLKQLESMPLTIEHVSTNGLSKATWVRADVKLNQTTMPAVLDLGATQTIVNAAGATAARLSVEANGRPRDLVVGADKGQTAGTAVQAQSLQLGPIVINKPIVLVADLPIFGAFGLSRQPGMILAIDQLSDRGLVIVSLSEKRIYLARAMAPKTTRRQ